MGKIIARKISGMNLWTKVALVTLCTLILSVFMYEGWYKPQGVQAAISSQQAWSSLYAGTSYPTSYTYTVNSGSNRLLVVAIASTRTSVGTQTVSVTYGGRPLTLAAGDGTSSATWNHSYLYYLDEAGLAAATSSTLNVSISGGTSYYNYVYAAVFAGVDQVTRFTDKKNINATTADSTLGPFSPVLNIAQNDQAIMIANTARSSAGTSVRTISSTNDTTWSTATVAQSYGTVSGPTIGLAIRNRNVLTASTTASTFTLNSTAWDSMTAMSIKAATVDTTAPAITAFTVPTTSSSLTISGITLTATDAVGVTGYLINESATPPSAASVNLATAPTSYTAASAGAKTLYAWARDAAGNVSAVYTGRPCTITLPDTTAPAITAFTVPTTSSSLTISGITLTATDAVGVTGYLINESATPPAAASVNLATAPTSYTAASEGAKTLYAWARDAAGNVSAVYTGRPCTITTADTTAPAISAFTVPTTSSSLTISGITLTATDAVGVTGYLINESATPPTAASVNLATAPTSYTAASAGAKTLYAWARDAAGNVSAVYTGRTCTITLDATKPTVTAFSVPATSSSLVISGITFAASDNVGVTGYLINESATPPAAAAITLATAPSSYTASSGGTKTLYAWVKDANGNVSNVYASQTCTITVLVVSPLMHSGANLGTKYSGGTWGAGKDCTWCHSSSTTNVKQIATQINTPNGLRNVVFSRMTASLSTTTGVFGNDQRPILTSSTNVCEVCHHQTTYHQYSSSKVAVVRTHNNSRDCMPCHPHGVGFKAAGCDGCHGYPPTALASTLATPATTALGTSPTTGGQHVIHTSKGMTCTLCHNHEGEGGHDINRQIKMGFVINPTNWATIKGDASTTFSTYSGNSAGAALPVSAQANTKVATTASTRNSCSVYCHGGWKNSAGTNQSWLSATALTCGSCHFTSANPPAAAGDHAVHLGLTGSLALTCSNCHPSSGYTTSHLSGSVDWALSGTKYNSTSKYKTGLNGETLTVAPSSAYGSCSTTNCHGQLSPVWGGTVGTTGQCQKCHGSQSVAFLTVTSAQVAPGTANIDTGRVAGVTLRGGMHQEHLKGTAGISEPVKCSECHLKVTAVTDAGHMNYSTATITFGGTAKAASHTNPIVRRVGGAITCDNTYCHTGNRPAGTGANQSGLNNTPAWNNATFIGGTTIADTCTAKCHAMPPGGGIAGDSHSGLTASGTYTTPASLASCSSVSPATGCHPTINAAPTSMLTIFFDKVLHINGSVEGGSCVGCHSKTILRTKGRLAGKNVYLSAVSTEFGLAWGHKKTGRGAVTDADCIVCHLEGTFSTGKPSTTYHQDGNIDLRNPDGSGEAPITDISGAAFVFQRFSTSYAANSRTSTGQSANTIDNVIQRKFCLACHDGDGAINTSARTTSGTATMPWGGINLGATYTVANGSAVAGGVVNALAQFALTNSSRHPVLGPRSAGYPTTARLAAPYNGFTRTAGTLANSVVINCFDCHNQVGTPLTLRTVAAHGNAVTIRGVATVSGTPSATNDVTFCKVCHTGYVTGSNNHGTGSALTSSTNSSMTSYLNYGCNICHSSGYATAVVRPVRAMDAHGVNALPTTGTKSIRWAGTSTGTPATVNAKPYAFIRNTSVLSDHSPAKIGATTYSANCNMAASPCSQGSKTYSVGGVY